MNNLISLCCIVLGTTAALTFSTKLPINIRPHFGPTSNGGWVKGIWYLKSLVPSIAWPGIVSLTDMAADITHIGPTTGFAKTVWRSSGLCTYTQTKAVLTKKWPEEVFVIDTIGGAYTRYVLVVAVDPTCYTIVWACYTFTDDSKTKCVNPAISIYTRTANPTKKCARKYSQKLFEIWGLRIVDLVTHSHNNPCMFSPPCAPVKYGMGYWA